MQFQLSEEHVMIQKAARDFAINECLPGVIERDEHQKFPKEQIEKFEIHTFKRNNGYKKEIVNIDIKGKEIINCKMISTNKNTLKIVGFYSSVRENGKANKELKGVYNATVDLNTNATNAVKFNEFDYATKVKLLGERRAKKGKDVKPYYNITTIIEKNDFKNYKHNILSNNKNQAARRLMIFFNFSVITSGSLLEALASLSACSS